MEKELEKLMGDKKIPLTTLFKRTFHYVKPELPRFLFALFTFIIYLCTCYGIHLHNADDGPRL